MQFRLALALILTLVGADVVAAQSIGFVGNPTANSADFAAAVAAYHGTVNATMNFDTAAVGPLQSNLYSGLGVTLSAAGIFATAVNNAGPNQSGNTVTKSPGEGVHPASNGAVGRATFRADSRGAITGLRQPLRGALLN